MDTSALSSEMTMGRRPIAKSGLFLLVSIEEVHIQGGYIFGWWRSPIPFVTVVYRNVSQRLKEVKKGILSPRPHDYDKCR
jgi:hypothetical protein